MRRVMKRAATTLATTAAIGMMLVGPASVASAESGVDLGSTATLVAKGAAVLVPVNVTCGDTMFPATSFTMVTVKERSSNRIVQGNSSANVTCDGMPQTVEVLVMAQDAPFKPGTALATASVFSCGPGCGPDTAEIRIRH